MQVGEDVLHAPRDRGEPASGQGWGLVRTSPTPMKRSTVGIVFDGVNIVTAVHPTPETPTPHTRNPNTRNPKPLLSLSLSLSLSLICAISARQVMDGPAHNSGKVARGDNVDRLICTKTVLYAPKLSYMYQNLATDCLIYAKI